MFLSGAPLFVALTRIRRFDTPCHAHRCDLCTVTTRNRARSRRVKQQEARKEKKALKAAQVEKSIEKELLSRLHAGTYGDIYNFPSMQYNKALDKEAVADGEEEAERAVARRAAAVAAGGSEDEGAEEEEESEEGEMELEYESDDVRSSSESCYCAAWFLPVFQRGCEAGVLAASSGARRSKRMACEPPQSSAVTHASASLRRTEQRSR